MNIKQASDASGISSRNIRYYEQAGLLCPARDPQNDYRTYTEQDIRTLKLIRMLRMLGVPLEEIRPILQGEVPLYRAAEQQAQRLQQQAQELEAVRRFCCQLQENHTETASLDVDACLAHMQTTAADGWFTGWLRDYRTMTRAEHRYSFTFTPDLPVTTPAEFTDALFAYAKEQNLNLVVTKEGMVPHFTIDGVEYRAIRRYYPFRGIPTARIRCVLCDPDFSPAQTSLRMQFMRLIHYAAPALAATAVALLFLIPRGLLTTWWGLLLLVGCIAAGICSAWYNTHLFYNDKDHQPHYR